MTELLFGSAYLRLAASTAIQYDGGGYSDPPPPEILQRQFADKGL
jgi:hypothetical protein